MATKKSGPPLRDRLGRMLAVGDSAAIYCRSYKGLRTGRVSRFTTVQVCIEWEKGGRKYEAFAKPYDIVIIDNDAYVAYCLTQV